MKKKMHFTIMGLVVAVLALALALTGCAKDASGNTNASTSESVDVNADMQDQESRETLVLEGTVWRVETVSTSDGTTHRIYPGIHRRQNLRRVIFTLGKSECCQ